MELGLVFRWRIENLSHWCWEVHGECIRSPDAIFGYFTNIELYPRGIGGIGEYLEVKLRGIHHSFCGDVSICCSDGTELCKLRVNAAGNERVIELSPEKTFEDVLSRIQKDFVTVKCRIEYHNHVEQSTSTIINVSVISVKINAGFFAGRKLNETLHVCWIPPNGTNERFELDTCLKNNTVQFTINPSCIKEYPIGVDMRLTKSRSKREHVFRDNTPWTFPDSFDKNEVVEKGITLILCFKTRTSIQSISSRIFKSEHVSVDLDNKICPSGVSVPTKDSYSQTSPTPDVPDVPAVSSSPVSDSVQVLTQDLMCLYQDQDFSDITLKCGHVTFPVHKGILSARSPVFKTMLSTDMTEAASGQVVVEDLDPSTLSLFLAYLYTGAVENLECERALKLYYAADKYQVPSLKVECSDFLCSSVSISNVCDILSLGDRHRDDQLTSVAHDFILNDYSEVLKSGEWQSFICREPLLAVKTVTQFAAALVKR